MRGAQKMNKDTGPYRHSSEVVFLRPFLQPAEVLYYAGVKLDMVIEGGASVRNRRLRQACKKRETAARQ